MTPTAPSFTAPTRPIPSSVKSIGYNAFYKCSSLKQITIPSSVVSINNNCFSECSSLEKISLPQHLKELKFYFDHQVELEIIWNLLFDMILNQSSNENYSSLKLTFFSIKYIYL